MQLAGFEVDAVSVGGLDTCIQLPAFDLCFDIGRCPQSAVRRRRLFLTHTHVDHAGGLATHAATRDLQGLAPSEVWCPAENADDLRALLDVWRRLDRSSIPATIHGVSPGDRIPLGPTHVVTPFRSPHRTICQGYTVSRVTRKLLPGLAGASQEEIRARVARGEAVSEVRETPEVVFSGDAMIEIVDREPAVRRARLLILECTFLDDRVPVHRARGSGHIHLDELVARADVFENEAILLTHFSARYTVEEIRRILHTRLPPGLRERVTPLLPPEAYLGR